jgi:hypothetical protein
MGSTVAGLQLADGRLVKLPGVRSLPEYSTALYEVARRGVEIDAEGRVWGLVRVHHWCGNDPIGEHIARVDVARFLIYLDDAIQDSRIVERDIASTRGSFRSFGWNVSEYHGLMQRQQ